jgi:O-antigen ligase
MLAAGAAVLVLVPLVGAFAAGGGPVSLAERAKAAFLKDDPPATETSLDRRMLSVSGNGRAAYWRVAARMARREPLHGAGAGSFARIWTKERPIGNEARDAHNLYLETLAELGPLGVALILAVLIVPFTVIPAARRERGATAAAGVLATFAVHAAVDWDWEVPLLALVAVAAACALLVLDTGRRLVVLRPARRAALLALAAICLAAALVVHVGNRAAASALEAIAADRPREAATAAERARTWIPWSAEGDRLLGEARAEAGADAAARVALRRAIRRDPGDWGAWYDLATVSSGLERVNAVTRARDLNPLSVEVAGLAAEE